MLVTDRTESDSAKTLVYLCLPLLFLVIIFPAAFQPDQVFIAEYHDTMSLLMPHLFLMEDPFALWNNLWITGYSEISNVNSDRFYPFSLPLTLVSRSIFSINLILLIHLYIAYLAFFRLGSLLVRNPDLLMLFSLGYMFSGALISRVFIGNIFFVYAMAWIPLLYYFFLKITFRSEETVFNIVALAVCELLIFLASGTYYFFFANTILFVFVLSSLLSGTMSRSTGIAFILSGTLFALLSAIRLIPNLTMSGSIVRIDTINPLGDGGSLENNLAAFVFGTPIDTVFGSYESMALIGILMVFLAIIALLYGNRDIVTPAFFSIVAAFVWADGGRTLLSFIHLFPFLNNFRCAGRIFGALMPLLLLLSLYGMSLLHQKIKTRESFALTGDQKKKIHGGIAVILAVKILEVPFLALPSIEAILSLILVSGFILLLYLNRANESTLLWFFAGALLVNIAVLINNFRFADTGKLVAGVVVALLLGITVVFLNRNFLHRLWFKQTMFVGLLVIGLVFSLLANISVLNVSDPQLDESPALGIIEKIREQSPTTPRIWVYETGWPIQHMDFTYWFMKHGIHPMRAYYSQFPINTVPPAIMLGNTTYFTADYLIDTKYLENGNQNLPLVSFMVNNISVYRPEPVFPNAFVIRNNQVIPAQIEKFSPDEVILSGQFFPGDIAVLKTAFYPGWKINNADAVNAGTMVGGEVREETSKITFTFDPLDVKIGALLSGLGILALIGLVFFRQDIDRYLATLNRAAPVTNPGPEGAQEDSGPSSSHDLNTPDKK